jgi:5-(aminomethyl)-3-furanmethanol phosphate kinase
MRVIKLGGSLLASGGLIPCLTKINERYAAQGGVIVPGGGVLADQIRQLQQEFGFDDRAAHKMAILAMQQMGLLLKGLCPHFEIISSIKQITAANNSARILIWSPDIAELDKAGIPSSWDITSDSLSAWLAATVAAEELLLIKSATITENVSLAQLTEDQVVDKAFCTYCPDAAGFKLTIINVQEFIAS